MLKMRERSAHCWLNGHSFRLAWMGCRYVNINVNIYCGPEGHFSVPPLDAFSLRSVHFGPSHARCYSLDAFSFRSVHFSPSHANAIRSPLLLSARYNSAHHPPTHIRHSSIIMYVSNMRSIYSDPPLICQLWDLANCWRNKGVAN